MRTRVILALCVSLLAALVLLCRGEQVETWPAAVTVGRSGCDFPSIQEAIDAAGAGGWIHLVDPVHTEAGILVTKDIFIIGDGADATILQASVDLATSVDRIFRVQEGASLVLCEMTLRHGHPTICPKGGGAISNAGTLWLLECVLRENQGQCGGAVLNEGTFYAYDTMFLDNEATSGLGRYGDRARGSGGAIKNVQGRAFLSGCTIAGNRAAYHGGGLKGCCNGLLCLVNCTIAQNEATKQGGGIHTRGRLEMIHCTMVDNGASIHLARFGSVIRAAGIYIDGPTILAGSIIAQNDGCDVHLGEDAEILQNAACLVGDASLEATYTGDPMISDFGEHGGRTWTYVPLDGSPVIDGAPAGFSEIDQRGALRPRGSACDVGSVEL